jgi:hypothetical protein
MLGQFYWKSAALTWERVRSSANPLLKRVLTPTALSGSATQIVNGTFLQTCKIAIEILSIS